MEWVVQFVAHTPWWVYVLFAYLISRGIRARKLAAVTPLQLALFPALMIGWGLAELGRIHGVGASSLGPWLIALAVGLAIGHVLMRGVPLEIDRARGLIHRPADFTVLPLILIVFAIKYAFGVMGAVSPDLLQAPLYRVLDVGTSGLFAGIFLGKFASYMRRYFAEPLPARQ